MANSRYLILFSQKKLLLHFEYFRRSHWNSIYSTVKIFFAIHFNDLDIELLEDELDKDAEALEFSELDIDLLDVDFLRDLLDVFEEIDREEEEDVLQEEGVLALVGTNLGFDPTTQISSFLQGQQVVLQRQVENYSRLELMQNSGYTIKLDDGGERFNIIINTGGDVYISIVQEWKNG